MHGYSRYNIILFCLIFYWLAKKSVNFGGDDISVSVFHKTKSFFKVYYETTIMFCKKGWFWFNWKYINFIEKVWILYSKGYHNYPAFFATKEIICMWFKCSLKGRNIFFAITSNHAKFHFFPMVCLQKGLVYRE